MDMGSVPREIPDVPWAGFSGPPPVGRVSWSLLRGWTAAAPRNKAVGRLRKRVEGVAQLPSAEMKIRLFLSTGWF